MGKEWGEREGGQREKEGFTTGGQGAPSMFTWWGCARCLPVHSSCSDRQPDMR